MDPFSIATFTMQAVKAHPGAIEQEHQERIKRRIQDYQSLSTDILSERLKVCGGNTETAEATQRTAQKALTKLRKLFVDLGAAGLLPSAIADIFSGDLARTIVMDNDKETNNADDKENELAEDIEAWKESTGSMMRSVAKVHQLMMMCFRWTLAKIYLDIDTERSVEEAEEVLRNLCPGSESRAVKLEIRPGSGKLDIAEKIAILATKGRLNIKPIDTSVIRGIDDSIGEILEGKDEDDARAWYRSFGFDLDSETFRFNVCDSRRSSPLWGFFASPRPSRKGATRQGEIDTQRIVKLLLRHASDINAGDRNNRSALRLCQDNTGGTAVAQLLHDHESRKIHVDDLDRYKKATIHMASEMGNTKTMRWLLKHNANVNAIGPGGRISSGAIKSHGNR
ncbi:hypothetical protein DL767_001260 [Monosporascus sp. MG133]|nr:hypothetical protein DL767_001260 [Monosporascus sp. MG133]